MRINKPEKDGVRRADVGSFRCEQDPQNNHKLWVRVGNDIIVEIKASTYDYATRQTTKNEVKVIKGEKIKTDYILNETQVANCWSLGIKGGVPDAQAPSNIEEPSLASLIKSEAQRLQHVD